MRLRPYQQEAVASIEEAFAGEARAALVVMPTGTGKTQVFTAVAQEFVKRGRVMMLAHREELIWQAARRYEGMGGFMPEIEMAELQASNGVWSEGRVVVSSIQTQISGRRRKRFEKFDPEEFALLIVDEAHHACARSWRRVIHWYQRNEDLRVLGVTATPDRHDEQALGKVFDTVAYDYEITDAIRDGWLAPITQRAVHVDGLDFSGMRTTAGDLNGADLAQVMEYEQVLHGLAGPVLEIAGERKTLVFAASLAHAERLCEIFNRHRPGSARWVQGKTPKAERRSLFRDYAHGRFQFLVNVGIATEGFDDPSIQVVAVGRPTKSRALYAQMVGRGTRPLPGVVDLFDDADERRLAIASSAKPHVEVLDFEGNAGRHKLMSAADILGGKYDDQVVARAKLRATEEGQAGREVDMFEELERAQREIEAEAERARRAKLRAQARYRTETVNPFDVLGLRPWQERGWDKGRQPTPKMVSFLERAGIRPGGLTFAGARQLIQETIRRREEKRATFKQARLLAKFGYDSDVTFEAASKLIDTIAKNGWRRPASINAAVGGDEALRQLLHRELAAG